MNWQGRGVNRQPFSAKIKGNAASQPNRSLSGATSEKSMVFHTVAWVRMVFFHIPLRVTGALLVVQPGHL